MNMRHMERRASTMLLCGLAVAVLAGGLSYCTPAPAAEVVVIVAEQRPAELPPEPCYVAHAGLGKVYRCDPDATAPRGPVDSPSFVNLGFDKPRKTD